MAMLFDFFGDLLTEKQQSCFSLRYNDDLSLSEIAESEGITRQGVRDLLMRAEQSLLEFEEKTGVLKRFCEMQEAVGGIESDLVELLEITGGRAREIVENVLERVKNLRD